MESELRQRGVDAKKKAIDGIFEYLKTHYGHIRYSDCELFFENCNPAHLLRLMADDDHAALYKEVAR